MCASTESFTKHGLREAGLTVVWRYLAFVRCELLMHVKSWRLWLCLAALLAAAMPWKLLMMPIIDMEVLDDVAAHFLEIRQIDWLVFVPILILITVDTVARAQAVGVYPLLYTKPFSALSLTLASWTAVVILAGLLAGATLFARYVVGRFYFHLALPLPAFGWLLALAVVPAAMGLVAAVIWVRTLIKQNLVAYVISAVLAGAIYAATAAYDLPFLGWKAAWIGPLVQPYLPGIGRDLDWPGYGLAFGYTLALSLLFISLACYHLRRQGPQRAARREVSGAHWATMPTFRALVSDLMPDRRAGAAVHLFCLATMAFAGAQGLQWVQQRRATANRMQAWATELRRDFDATTRSIPGLMIRQYAGDVEISGRERMKCDLRLEIANTTTTAVDSVALTLPFGMSVERINGERVAASGWRQWGNLVVADFRPPLAAASTTTVHIAYQGSPQVLEIGNPIPFTNRYEIDMGRLDEAGVTLGSRYSQINGWLLPRTVRIAPQEPRVAEMPRLFTADLRLALFNNLQPVSPDGAVEALEPEGGLTRARLGIAWPRSDFSLFAGPYETVEQGFGPIRLRVLCFPGDREVLEFALEELSETVERWGTMLGERQCVLIETSGGRWAGDTVPPGVLAAADLDRLRRYRPFFERREPQGYIALRGYEQRLSAALAGRILHDSFHPDAQTARLRDALFQYLVNTVQPSEVGPTAVRNARLFQVRRVGNLISFLDPLHAASFNRPLIERLREPTFRSFDAMHIWQMLHFLLEDQDFAKFLQTLLRENRDRVIAVADIRAAAERFYDGSLGWFFDHWLYGVGTPNYEVAEARATMMENDRTRDIEYDVRAVVANKGRGRMPVPVVLQTERDRITRMVWLDSGTSETIVLHVPDRPETVYVDPEGWITQETMSDPEARLRGPAWRRVRIIE